MTQEKFEQNVNQIQSLFTTRHAHIIYGLVRWLRPRTCVEIGSFAGYISAWIAKALDDNDDGGVLFAVDNFTLGTTSQQLHNNLASLELANRVIVCDKFPEGINCDLAFIDGDHSFFGVANDFLTAANAGAECIILHDTTSWWGPQQFVSDNMNWHGQWNLIKVPFDQGLTILMKRFPEQPLQYTEQDYPKGHI